MSKDEALETLNERAREVDYAEGRRVSAILDALLAGASQRETARWSRLSVNTVRAIMQDAGVSYGGMRYVAVPAAEVRRIDTTNTESEDEK